MEPAQFRVPQALEAIPLQGVSTTASIRSGLRIVPPKMKSLGHFIHKNILAFQLTWYCSSLTFSIKWTVSSSSIPDYT
jgi:hypothetical protein